MQITEKKFTSESGLYVTLEYANGMATSIIVQERDGEVIFSGDYDQAAKLIVALNEVQHFENRDENREDPEQEMLDSENFNNVL